MCLLLFPLSGLFGRQTLNLTIRPRTGEYNATYLYQDPLLLFDGTASAKPARMQLNKLIYKNVSYIRSYSDSSLSLVNAGAWEAVSYAHTAFSVSLLRGAGRLHAATLNTGAFTTAFIKGPDAARTDDIALVWDEQMIGSNLFVQYRHASDRLTCNVHLLWGRYRRLEVGLTALVDFGSVKLQCEFNDPAFSKQFEVVLQQAGRDVSFSHRIRSTLGHPPLYGGHSQTLYTSCTTKVEYKGFRLGYEQEFQLDEQHQRTQLRSMHLEYAYAGTRFSLLLASNADPKAVVQDSYANLAIQASGLAASFAFQHDGGAIKVSIHPHKGLTLTFSYLLHPGRHGESLPPA